MFAGSVLVQKGTLYTRGKEKRNSNDNSVISKRENDKKKTITKRQQTIQKLTD